MRAIERNYRKNPHTASFLQIFHTGVGSNGRDYRAEMVQAEADLRDDAKALHMEASQDDLLDLVDEDKLEDARTPGQVRFMEDLVARLTKLDTETGAQAREFTDRITAKGGWTSGRGGNASQWIDRMIARERELSAKVKTNPVALATVADGRYAVEEDGVLRFFKVKNGARLGFVFLDVQASDEWHSIRNLARIRSILVLIAADPKGAMARYGQEIGECGRCGRALTSEYRKLGIGPICIDK